MKSKTRSWFIAEKKNSKTSISLRVNSDIFARKVRLITEKGEQYGVANLEEALRMAEEANLDLVEISPNTDPPVCKILNYGKYRYDKEKQKKINKKKQHIVHVKEIRLRLNTGDNDLLIKLKKAKQFLQNGDKLKITVMFRGREINRKDIGILMLSKVEELLSEISKVDKKPNLEGHRLTLVLSPK